MYERGPDSIVERVRRDCEATVDRAQEAADPAVDGEDIALDVRVVSLEVRVEDDASAVALTPPQKGGPARKKGADGVWELADIYALAARDSVTEDAVELRRCGDGEEAGEEGAIEVVDAEDGYGDCGGDEREDESRGVVEGA